MTYKFDIDPVTTSWPMPGDWTTWPSAPHKNSNKELFAAPGPAVDEKILQTKELSLALDRVATYTTWQRIKRAVARGLKL